MSHLAPRSNVRKTLECAQALRWSVRRGGPWRTDPRQVRNDWLNHRFNLLPESLDLTSGPVLDVGANKGEWTAALLRLVPAVEVVALEPAPLQAELLRDRFSGDRRVLIKQVAASDAVGKAVFHLTEHSHNNSLLTPRDMNKHYGGRSWDEIGQVTVETMPLDSLGVVGPSLIKIDVQGAENLVLAGASTTLARTTAVLLEITASSHYEGDSLANDLDQQMRSVGFAEYRRSDPWVDVKTGSPLWWDACYTRYKR